jgi:hypothetical protein
MFFEFAKDARIYASIQTTQTGRRHSVVACRKYICPPALYFGSDSRPGFTVILK